MWILSISPIVISENVSSKFSRSGGLTVERHADHFAPDTPDEEWLETVGKRGWIALTHDRRIRYKPNERDAVIRHNVALFAVVGAAPFRDLALAPLSRPHGGWSASCSPTSRHSSRKSIAPLRLSLERGVTAGA